MNYGSPRGYGGGPPIRYPRDAVNYPVVFQRVPPQWQLYHNRPPIMPEDGPYYVHQRHNSMPYGWPKPKRHPRPSRGRQPPRLDLQGPQPVDPDMPPLEPIEEVDLTRLETGSAEPPAQDNSEPAVSGVEPGSTEPPNLQNVSIVRAQSGAEKVVVTNPYLPAALVSDANTLPLFKQRFQISESNINKSGQARPKARMDLKATTSFSVPIVPEHERDRGPIQYGFARVPRVVTPQDHGLLARNELSVEDLAGPTLSKRDAIEQSSVAAEKLPKFDLIPSSIECIETGVGRPVPACELMGAGAAVPAPVGGEIVSQIEVIDSTVLTNSENRVFIDNPMGAGVPMDTNQENEVVDVNLLPLHQCENITCQAQTTAFVSDPFTVGKGAAGPAAPGLPGSAVVYRGFYRQMESMDTRNRRVGITHEPGCLREKCKCRRLTCNIWTVQYPHAPPETKTRKDYDGKFVRDKDTGLKSFRTWSQIRNFRRRNQIQATINEARPTDHMGLALLKRVKTAKAIIDKANEVEAAVRNRQLDSNEPVISMPGVTIDVDPNSPDSDNSFHSANE